MSGDYDYNDTTTSNDMVNIGVDYDLEDRIVRIMDMSLSMGFIRTTNHYMVIIRGFEFFLKLFKARKLKIQKVKSNQNSTFLNKYSNVLDQAAKDFFVTTQCLHRAFQLRKKFRKFLGYVIHSQICGQQPTKSF